MKQTNNDIEMQKIILSPTSSKVEILEKQVADVQKNLQNNVNIALDNLNQTEDLECKTESLSRFSKEFSVQANKTKRKYYWKSVKRTLLLTTIVGGSLSYFVYNIFD